MCSANTSTGNLWQHLHDKHLAQWKKLKGIDRTHTPNVNLDSEQILDTHSCSSNSNSDNDNEYMSDSHSTPNSNNNSTSNSLLTTPHKRSQTVLGIIIYSLMCVLIL